MHDMSSVFYPKNSLVHGTKRQRSFAVHSASHNYSVQNPVQITVHDPVHSPVHSPESRFYNDPVSTTPTRGRSRAILFQVPFHVPFHIPFHVPFHSMFHVLQSTGYLVASAYSLWEAVK